LATREKDSAMSMLAHRFENPAPSSARGNGTAATLTAAHRATMKRVCRRLAAVLLMGGVLAALIALKTAIFFWRFQYP
jgi:hypothetical protein